MKNFKQIFVMITASLVLLTVLSGCGGKKTIYMEDVIQANELQAEPANWVSEEAITTLVEARLPADLQRNYMELIGAGYNRVIMKDLEGWEPEIKSNEDGIYVGIAKNNYKYFQSASGNIVGIGKVYRTLYRREYFDNESRTAYDAIELDYNPQDANLVRVAVTDDFSVMYNIAENVYQCMQYGEVIGTTPVTYFDAIMNPEKGRTSLGGCKGFLYNDEWYIPVVERNDDMVNFYIVKEEDFVPTGTEISYADMKIGSLTVEAYTTFG